MRARETILFVHSHPGGLPDFSPQDDREEPGLHSFFADYATETLHGSMVISSAGGDVVDLDASALVHGRVATPSGWVSMDRVRILGDRFRFLDRSYDGDDIAHFFDRQVHAFGPDIQKLLARLHVGVVGAGGTGSAVIEQLTRLGIGQLSVFDGDEFAVSNVNRVYGSSGKDGGHPKAAIQQEHVSRIGVGTTINAYPSHIDSESVAKRLRCCDLVFGCTDNQSSRAILVRLALFYLIPVLDLGVRIEAPEQIIRDVVGRVTILVPGEACLFCRGRISAEGIRQEGLLPEERDQQNRDGYIPQLASRAPAVITFTTAVAAQAVTEFLHRLTGFMEADRNPSEILMRFDKREISTNRFPADGGCLCMIRQRWGRGDEGRFLGRGWAARK
jgi:hypothetical protein